MSCNCLVVLKNLKKKFWDSGEVRCGCFISRKSHYLIGLCARTFNDHVLIFLQTKRLAHKMRIILGLLGLKAAELHGNLTQLQVQEVILPLSKYPFISFYNIDAIFE